MLNERNDEMNVVLENEDVKVETSDYEEPVYVDVVDDGGNNVIGVVVGIAASVIAAGAAVYYFTKDKRKARFIKKLEREGYVIEKPDIENAVCGIVEETDEDEE